MDITVSSSDNLTGTLVLPIWKGETSLTDPKTAGMPQKTKEVVSNVLSSGNFEGKAGATLTLFTATEQTVLLVGMGPRDDADLTRVRHSGAKAADRGTYQGPRQPDGSAALRNEQHRCDRLR